MIGTDCAAEFAGAAFGDARLSRRAMKLAERMARQPDASFPDALDEAELEAAYRFFKNRKVTAQSVLAPHVRATVGRAQGQVCVVVHDTTTFSFRPDGEREGLGRDSRGTQTLHAHVTLAVGADRNPLGVLALRTHVGKAATTEHERWREQVLALDNLEIGRDQLVHVMDREADDYAFLASFQERGDRFVVRAQHDRILAVIGDNEPGKLWEALPVRAVEIRTVPLSTRSKTRRGPKQRRIHPDRKERVVKLAIGAGRVRLSRRKEMKEGPPTLDINVVRVWELDPPEDETPIEWVLFTSEPIDLAPQLAQVVDWYRARWVIEEYFKTLKTGCAYEKRQLETRDALENALALFLPIAWQLLSLRSLARDEPGKPAADAMSASQLAVLHRVARRPLPQNPTLGEAILAIAALGGHLKRNGEPGWITLWRGYEKLLAFTAGWNLARQAEPPRTYDQS
jgi:hypothetical protein